MVDLASRRLRCALGQRKLSHLLAQPEGTTDDVIVLAVGKYECLELGLD